MSPKLMKLTFHESLFCLIGQTRSSFLVHCSFSFYPLFFFCFLIEVSLRLSIHTANGHLGVAILLNYWGSLILHWLHVLLLSLTTPRELIVDTILWNLRTWLKTWFTLFCFMSWISLVWFMLLLCVRQWGMLHSELCSFLVSP